MSFNSFRVTCTKTHNVSLKFHVKEINITLFSLYCFEKPQILNINTIKLSLSTESLFYVTAVTCLSIFHACLYWCRSGEHSSLRFVLQPYIWSAGVWGSANPTQNKNSLSLLLRIWSQSNQLPKSTVRGDRTPYGKWFILLVNWKDMLSVTVLCTLLTWIWERLKYPPYMFCMYTMCPGENEGPIWAAPRKKGP